MRWLGAACVLIVSMSSGARASAQEPAFRLTVDGSIFQTTTMTQEVRDFRGGTMETEVSLTTVSLFAPELRLNAGFALPIGIIVGARLGYASITAENEDRESVTTTQFVLGPYLEYAFLPGNSVRPAIAVSVGLEGSGQETELGDASRTAPFFEAGFWLHLFANESVSIGPSLWVRYSTGDLEREERTGFGGTTPVDVPQSNTTFGVGLTIGGWIGLGDSPPPDAPTVAELTQPTAPPPAPEPPPPPPGRITDWGDRLTMSIALQGAGLDLLSAPRTDPTTVSFRLAKLSRSPELAGCASIVLATGSGSLEIPARYDSGPASGHLEERILGTIAIDVLERLSREEGARITACSRTWTLDWGARSQMGEYATRFRSLAPPPPPPPPPPPEPTAPPPSDAALEPAAPPAAP